jgi:hypothetical protein
MDPRQLTAGNEPRAARTPRAQQPARARPSARPTPSTGGGWRSRSPGPAANGSGFFGTGSGLTIAEMNGATRRMAELQAPWIAEDRPR